METNQLIALDILLALMLALVAYGIYGVVLPAEAEYNWYFGRHVLWAYGSDTYDGIEREVTTVWNQMNITFSERKYNETYCTPWFWEQTYHNTLAAQNEYLQQIIDRVHSYRDTYQEMRLNNTDPNYRDDWFRSSIQDLKTSMTRGSGMDWAIRGVWFLTFAPAAYWLNGWLVPIGIIIAVAIAILTAYIIFYAFIFM